MHMGDEKKQYLAASVTIRNNIKMLIPLLEFMRTVCRGIGLSETKQEHAIHVIEEIMTFRIEKAYSAIGMITLDTVLQLDRVSFVVRDNGTPYLLSEDSEDLAETMARCFAETFTMNIEPGRGQSITFAFSFDQNDYDLEKFRRTVFPEEKLLDREIVIRPTDGTDDEIIKAIECIYAAYGYSYAREKLYNLDSFHKLLDSGAFHSYLAVNESRQVLAHASLSDGEFMKGVPDLGTLVTKSFCRGLHIAERLVDYMLKDARQLKYRGVRGEPVAFHPFTQKLFTANGMVPMGFLFHELCPETAGIYRDGNRRLDLGLAQSVFHGEPVHRVILPEEHAAFLKKRFKAVGIPVQPFAADAPAKPGYFKKSLDTTLRLATLFVSGCEWMYQGMASDVMKELSGADNIDLYLDMNNPGSQTAYRKFLERGFFVTGLEAGGEDGDYLVMQHFLKSRLECSKLVLEPEYQEVLDYLTGYMKEGIVR